MTKKESCWHMFDVFGYCSSFTGRMRQLYQYGEFLECKQYMKMFLACGLEDVTEKERLSRFQQSLDDQYGKVWRLREDFYPNLSQPSTEISNQIQPEKTNEIENNSSCLKHETLPGNQSE